jgi:hypothetical protein
MIDAGVEDDASEQMFGERRKLHVLRHAAIAAPMIGHRAAAMREDEFEAWEMLEQAGGQELHERRGVAVEIVGARGVKIRVAGGADVNHGGPPIREICCFLKRLRLKARLHGNPGHGP